MGRFPQAVMQAMEFMEDREAKLWLGRLDQALERQGIEADRRIRWRRALGPFLARHVLQPDLLRQAEVERFIQEQSASGLHGTRDLIDLIQASSFFYECVVDQRELAGEPGHPFDMPAVDWALATIMETFGSLRPGWVPGERL